MQCQGADTFFYRLPLKIVYWIQLSLKRPGTQKPFLVFFTRSGSLEICLTASAPYIFFYQLQLHIFSFIGSGSLYFVDWLRLLILFFIGSGSPYLFYWLRLPISFLLAPVPYIFLLAPAPYNFCYWPRIPFFDLFAPAPAPQTLNFYERHSLPLISIFTPTILHCSNR